ncbi:hypothetical protein BDK51DRAFT_30105 [Blyttiomyces helicus]|uniref:Uncharacterized protein n=1 Tax=Blyttiomyces helicus TaxID=388810 RepID=A0A4P9WF04_9FUNG|nr:hypothetical protein BDK51DRAFT_30105 [Blyttiomyces helicus]|eukprot:RKO91311.1 hypothetical protein BDK51DRAFT_30105 [Blyttiomyces helicus]
MTLSSQQLLTVEGSNGVIIESGSFLNLTGSDNHWKHFLAIEYNDDSLCTNFTEHDGLRHYAERNKFVINANSRFFSTSSRNFYVFDKFRNVGFGKGNDFDYECRIVINSGSKWNRCSGSVSIQSYASVAITAQTSISLVSTGNISVNISSQESLSLTSMGNLVLTSSGVITLATTTICDSSVSFLETSSVIQGFQVNIGDTILLNFGTAGSVSSQGGNVRIPFNSVLNFGNGTTTIRQSMTNFSVESSTPIQLNNGKFDIGDSVTILDSIPDIDGNYLVGAVPSAQTFTIAVACPEIPADAIVQGTLTSLQITTKGITDSTLTATDIVFADLGGKLITSNLFTFCNNTLTVPNISSFQLLGNINLNGGILTDGNISSTSLTQDTITQSTIDSTPIGSQVPSTGIFTNLTVQDSFSVSSTALVTNLNADMLDGYQASDFVLSEGNFELPFVRLDGTLSLTGDWNAGAYRITAQGITDTTLTQTCIVFADVDDSSPIGSVQPSTGVFTNLTINGSISVDSSAVVPNLNASFLDGYSASDFILTTDHASTPFVRLDGTTPLTGDWNAGPYRITAQGITDTTLTATNIVFADISGKLVTSGTANFNGENLTMAEITSSSIDSTVIGASIPSTGTFTNLSVQGKLEVVSTNLVTNLNADLLDGYNASDFVMTNQVGPTPFVRLDGTTSLTGDWNAGPFRITAQGITDTTLTATDIVFADISGKLVTNDSFTFANETLTVPNISGFMLTGNVNLNENSLLGGTFVNGVLQNSQATNLSIMTSTFDSGSISQSSFNNGSIATSEFVSGNSVAGGTVDSDITGNSGTVTNGLYTTDFTADETILTANTAGKPMALIVPDDTLIGRFGGNIAALNLSQLSQMLDFVPNNLYIDNSILKADVAQTPEPLTVPEGTIVGRQTGGLIDALTPDQVRTILDVQTITTQLLYSYGVLLRDGGNQIPGGGTMTGNLYTSSERFSLTTGQTQSLSVEVETSYISVNYSHAGGASAMGTESW